MADTLKHPITGDPIELAAGETLWRISWPGKPVLVIVRTNPAGEQEYRLAVPQCRTWSKVHPLPLEPWPAAS